MVGAMGIAATRALQQRQPEFVAGSAFLMTSQVTRHFMGTHGANDMPDDAEEYILPQVRVRGVEGDSYDVWGRVFVPCVISPSLL